MNFLACLGLVWIIKDSYIFKKPRDFLKSKSNWVKELLSCSQCLGFWVGVGLSFIEFKFKGFSYELYFIPFAVSAFCWFFDSLLDMIQETWVYYKNIREKN
jgi:hypothetical protein